MSRKFSLGETVSMMVGGTVGDAVHTAITRSAAIATPSATKTSQSNESVAPSISTNNT